MESHPGPDSSRGPWGSTSPLRSLPTAVLTARGSFYQDRIRLSCTNVYSPSFFCANVICECPQSPPRYLSLVLPRVVISEAAAHRPSSRKELHWGTGIQLDSWHRGRVQPPPVKRGFCPQKMLQEVIYLRHQLHKP